MLRQEFKVSVLKIANFIEKSNIRTIFSDIINSVHAPERKTKAAPSQIIELYNEVAIFYSQCDKNDLEILDIFGLKDMTNSQVWGSLFGEKREGQDLQRIYGWSSGAHDLTVYGTKVANVLDGDEKPRLVEEFDETLDLISFYVNENSDDVIHLKSFIDILTAVMNIFEIVANSREAPNTALLWKIDSGSKKFFSILGNKSAVKEIRQTIMEIWNAIRFSDIEKFEANCKAAANGCSLVESIAKLERSGAISAEEAASSKKKVVRELNRLFENGVYIDGMQGTKSLNIEQIEGPKLRMIEFRPSQSDASQHPESPTTATNTTKRKRKRSPKAGPSEATETKDT